MCAAKRLEYVPVCSSAGASDVDLAERLLERLHELALADDLTPARDLVRALVDRVPEADLLRPELRGRRAVGEEEAVLERDRRRVVEAPDEAPRERLDERVLEVVRAPVVEAPHALLGEEALDSQALDAELLADLGRERLDRLEPVGMVLSHVDRRGLLRAAALGRPRRRDRSRRLDPDRRDGVAHGDLPRPVGPELERRHERLPERRAREPALLGGSLERLLDALEEATVLDAGGEPREERDRLFAIRLAERVQRGIRDLDLLLGPAPLEDRARDGHDPLVLDEGGRPQTATDERRAGVAEPQHLDVRPALPHLTPDLLRVHGERRLEEEAHE